MASITINAKLDAVQAALQDQAKPERIQRALAALGRVLLTRIQLCFARSTAPNGAKWAPLKARKGQPLIDTGRLRASFTSKVAPPLVLVGTSVVYARTHQFGRGNIPARPFLPLSEAGGVELPQPWAKSALDAMARALKVAA